MPGTWAVCSAPQHSDHYLFQKPSGSPSWNHLGSGCHSLVTPRFLTDLLSFMGKDFSLWFAWQMLFGFCSKMITRSGWQRSRGSSHTWSPEPLWQFSRGLRGWAGSVWGWVWVSHSPKDLDTWSSSGLCWTLPQGVANFHDPQVRQWWGLVNWRMLVPFGEQLLPL